MIDIFLTAYIIIIILMLAITFGLYKLAMHFIKFKTAVRAATAAVLLAELAIILSAGYWLYENPRATDPEYDRGTCSVVLYNTTDTAVESVSVWIGENMHLADTATDIQPGEYRKLNIKTHAENLTEVVPPYNVYVGLTEDTSICVGYFGIDSGSFDVVKIVTSDDGGVLLEEETDTTSRLYLKALRKHGKNYNLMSWYD